MDKKYPEFDENISQECEISPNIVGYFKDLLICSYDVLVSLMLLCVFLGWKECRLLQQINQFKWLETPWI